MGFPHTAVDSVEAYAAAIKADVREWDLPAGVLPWFRGQADGSKPLIPSALRREFREHEVTYFFRKRAPGLGQTPEREALDEWLFLMQHVGVPTRLLDWTEGALIGLYFAIYEEKDTEPAVWMLHPLELNQHSIGCREFPAADDPEFQARVRLAFEEGEAGTQPIAVCPVHIHMRLRVQKGYFTLHGTDRRSFEELFEGSPMVERGFLRKYMIPKNAVEGMRRDLALLGITHSTLFPDLDGLAKELRSTF